MLINIFYVNNYFENQFIFNIINNEYKITLFFYLLIQIYESKSV